MHKTDRHQYILHQVDLHNKVLLTDLSDQLHVSNDTIRRDLIELSVLGKVIKIHGGAVSLSFHNGSQLSKEVYAYTQKKVIAQKAISLIRDNMFILSGGGTTVIEMAKEIPENLSATFISGSLSALIEYCKRPLLNVIAIGDKVNKESYITVGPEAISKIKELKADICFMGINAINEEGISEQDWEIVQVKKAMINASKKLVCLTISEKINTRQAIPICGVDKIDVLITELPPGDPVLKPYIDSGITVL